MHYEARWSRPIHIVLAGATLALSVLGLAAAGIIPSGSDPQPAVGWTIVAACLAGAAIFLMRAVDQKPQLRADARGIWTKEMGTEPVAWRDISSITPLRSGFQQIVRFETVAGGAFGINTTFYDRRQRALLESVRQFHPDRFSS